MSMSLSELTPATRLGVTLSQNYDSSATFAPANCKDSLISTLCATMFGASRHWASVQIAEGSAMHSVAVYNRQDSAFFRPWLGTIEVMFCSRAEHEHNIYA